MRVLGIDPGIATIGFGVVDSEKNCHKLVNCKRIIYTLCD